MSINRRCYISFTPAPRRAVWLILLCLLPTPLRAQGTKLIASDPSTGDEFGNVVALDGAYALVGARLDDPAGDRSGSAYIFVQRDGGWTQQDKLTADDGEVRDHFGASVAISGAYAAVGATGDDDGGDAAGAVYVFVRDGETWTQQIKLTASDGDEDDSLGRAVALDGDNLFVTAPGNDEQGENTGAVYVFTRDGETWTEQDKLTASDALPADALGSAVALDGDLAVVGAAGSNEPSGASGAAYIYEYDGAAWIERDKIFASDGTTNDFFGETVTLSGSDVLVGMRMDDDDGESSGSAYVFTRNGDVWHRQDKLTASDADAGDEFGTAVGFSGDLALIGAPGDDDDGEDAGAAYVFTRDGETWTEEVKLTAHDALEGAEFGNAIALSGVASVVGAFMDDDRAIRAGAAYVYLLAAPAAPQLVAPDDGALDVASNLVLDWDAVTGAATYHAQVATSAAFSTMVAEAPDLTRSSFLVANLAVNTTYFWRVAAANMLGVSGWSAAWRFTVSSGTGVEAVEEEVPAAYHLGPNYPNPFNPTTTIPFALPLASHVVLEVYDATGAAVETLVNEPLAAGRYTVTWDGLGLASGVYVVQMRAGDFSQTRKMILLK